MVTSYETINYQITKILFLRFEFLVSNIRDCFEFWISCFGFICLASRMVPLMNLLQPFSRHVGIDLCGGDVGMSEHQLNGA